MTRLKGDFLDAGVNMSLGANFNDRNLLQHDGDSLDIGDRKLVAVFTVCEKNTAIKCKSDFTGASPVKYSC